MVFPDFSDGYDPNEPIVADHINLYKRLSKAEGNRRYDQKKSFTSSFWNGKAHMNALIIRATYAPALYGQYVVDYKSGRVPDDCLSGARRNLPVRNVEHTTR
jgi:hypothetical protein